MGWGIGAETPAEFEADGLCATGHGYTKFFYSIFLARYFRKAFAREALTV